MPGPAGSAQIEDVFERFYTEPAMPFKGTDFTGRSDYGPFIAAGIPAGGLFTGAEGVKTAEEAALWGGTAGQQYDPCYHLACDTFANNNDDALDVNSDAVAYRHPAVRDEHPGRQRDPRQGQLPPDRAGRARWYLCWAPGRPPRP